MNQGIQISARAAAEFQSDAIGVIAVATKSCVDCGKPVNMPLNNIVSSLVDPDGDRVVKCDSTAGWIAIWDSTYQTLSVHCAACAAEHDTRYREAG